MMPRKLFQRMTDEQEAMAKAFVEDDIVAYEKAATEQEKLFSAWFRQFSPEQGAEWSACCKRLDIWVSNNVPLWRGCHLTPRAVDKSGAGTTPALLPSK